MMENCTIYNAVAGGLGEGHTHPCGIPQGCPLSMMLIAFLLRPWICQIRTLNARARILADDILTEHGSIYGRNDMNEKNATFRGLYTVINRDGVGSA